MSTEQKKQNDSKTKTTTTTNGAGAKTRTFAFIALTMFTSGVGWVGYQGFRAATDSFAAPAMLSADNDLVLNAKMKASEVAVERFRAAAELEAIDADLAAQDEVRGRLEALKASTSQALAFTRTVTTAQVTSGSTELKMLADQKVVLKEMVERQTALRDQMKRNLESGLVSKMDYANEEQALGRWQAALLDAERTYTQALALNNQAALTQRALANGNAPPTPEQVLRHEQQVRIDLEMMHIDSERRAKLAARKVVIEKIAKIDEMDAQLRARPIFRAMEKNMDVAFVPYTQIDGVTPGADVYDCIWGLFHCTHVGKVAEIVPGEVVLPDPWGNQARGQYAVLDVHSREPMKSKTLRIRHIGGAKAPATTEESAPARVSVR